MDQCHPLKKKSVWAIFACLLALLCGCSRAELTPVVAREASAFNRQQQVESDSVMNSLSISETTHVIPLGTAFGIKLFTDGVIVASLTDIPVTDGNSCPAKDAGIEPGDYIVSVNGIPAASNTDIAKVIGSSQGQPLSFSVKRNNEIFETTVIPLFSGGSFRTGMWIRDSAAGIGTLTFYNPDTGVFAGLGHGICDMDTSDLMALDHGEPAEISLCGIMPGEENSPGQLKGYFTTDEALGSLLANNDTGVYGTLSEAPQGEQMEVMPKEDVREGDVQILVTLDDSGPAYYDARIEKINPHDRRTQNLIVSVTDERLLAATGGIIQGMSGCPIIQDGKLAGAVTHVFVDDPTTGYGIFAETMVMETVVFGMSD